MSTFLPEGEEAPLDPNTPEPTPVQRLPMLLGQSGDLNCQPDMRGG